MSSGKYACDLCVDRRRRGIVLAGAVLAWLTGCLLLPFLPLSWPVSLILGAVWSTSSWLELTALARGMRRIDRIRITWSGELLGAVGGDDWQPLELLSGSLVLECGAWLRLRFQDGERTAEWLAPNDPDSAEWRLFQLVWRQRGRSFGRFPRS